MSTTLARKYIVQVTSDLTLAGGFIQLNGVDDWNDTVTPNVEETTAYDTVGWKSKEITLQDWSASASGFRRINSGTYDPGQELARATRGQFGDAGRCGVRFFDRNGGPEAYKGVGIVTWNRANTGVANVEKWTAAFDGDATYGALTVISNPGTAAVAAIVTSATPSAVAVGGNFIVYGVGFLGTTGGTGVKVGATNATSYIVLNDNAISAIMPAGSAGATTITVTNPVGVSNALAYTRGA